MILKIVKSRKNVAKILFKNIKKLKNLNYAND